MDTQIEPNQAQATLWNETAGRTWAEMQPVLDRMLRPFGERLIEEAFPGEGRSVLDVGCGSGDTTLQMARRLGPEGRCVGVDISGPLLAVARARAEPGTERARFIQADAQTHGFEPAAFDAVMSRFGVMFFEDPVAAFANLRRAAQKGAALTFLAWRGPAENPFFSLASEVASPFVDLPQPAPDAPGQFGFADPSRIRRILEASGWTSGTVEAVDIATEVPEADLMAYVIRLGPLGRVFPSLDAATQESTAEALRAAYAQYVRDGAARFNGACWLATARA